jgi:hypothetical protein
MSHTANNKMEKLNKKITLSFFVVATLLVSGFLVSGIGFSFVYSRERPVIVAPGESKDVQLYLQVSPEEGDRVIRASISKGQNVISLIDDSLDYSVSPGDGTPVNIRVSAPSSAVEGDRYDVTVTFTDATPSEDTGTVVFGVAASQSFDILVQVPPPEPEAPAPPAEEGGIGWLIVILVLIVAIIVIAYFLLKKKKQ